MIKQHECGDNEGFSSLMRKKKLLFGPMKWIELLSEQMLKGQKIQGKFAKSTYVMDLRSYTRRYLSQINQNQRGPWKK